MRIDTYVLEKETYVNSQTVAFFDKVNIISFKLKESQDYENSGQNGS